MAEFLLELFSEEIPARMQVKAADDLKDLIVKGLTEKGLTFTRAEAHSTPRRISVVIDGLPLENNPPAIDKKGPSITSPQQALDGFLKSIGQSDFSKCVQEETPKGVFWFYRSPVEPINTKKILRELIEDCLKDDMSWPKSMRWNSYAFSWVRPLRSILAIFDEELIAKDFRVPLVNPRVGEAQFTCDYSKKTVGHRFLSDGKSFEVSNFADYKEKLKKAHVLLDRADRKKIISEQSQSLANAQGLQVREDEALFEEIVGLVEWPVALVGTFEKEYLDVPQEVLISTMRGNQKYIALLDNNGKLANKFVVIANTETADDGAQVIAGNEKVLRARLSDAKFYWDQDRKVKLESRVAALDQITFHQKLGSVKDKVTRLQSLSAAIAKAIGANEKDAARAALLAKADLTAGVVFQFPEVQGIIGRYYALHDKETADVAAAISDHYKPIGANDSCPTAPVSIAVALADKIDTLVGFFAIDEKPTGSKDPFALRRATLGIIRIIIENKLNLDLLNLFEAAYNGYSVKGLRPLADVSNDLQQFFIDRLKVTLKDQGLKSGLIDAVTATGSFRKGLLQIAQRAEVLKDFLGTDDGRNLLAAYKRAFNIVSIEEKKDKVSYQGKFDKALLKEDEEIRLAHVMTHVFDGIFAALDGVDPNFNLAVTLMASLRKPVDAFFEKIHVNAPENELRQNRLRMLSYIGATMNIVADFSKIEG